MDQFGHSVGNSVTAGFVQMIIIYHILIPVFYIDDAEIGVDKGNTAGSGGNGFITELIGQCTISQIMNVAVQIITIYGFAACMSR